jgi:hypothetical protein
VSVCAEPFGNARSRRSVLIVVLTSYFSGSGRYRSVGSGTRGAVRPAKRTTPLRTPPTTSSVAGMVPSCCQASHRTRSGTRQCERRVRAGRTNRFRPSCRQQDDFARASATLGTAILFTKCWYWSCVEACPAEAGRDRDRAAVTARTTRMRTGTSSSMCSFRLSEWPMRHPFITPYARRPVADATTARRAGRNRTGPEFCRLG